ncbi:MAG: hypothetical protein HZY78_02585 [Burkholderiaceae bacterium]|nr:MAG: hypothetical protein HZY78_02585 [Burkholderiaceae bacterium]
MRYRLLLQIQSYWHIGTGRDAGAAVDVATHRDQDGLPCVPGRHIKGLLRDAFERAHAWGWAGHADGMVVAHLFGQRTERITVDGAPTSGALRVSDARLPEDLRAWLRADAQSAQRAALFRILMATAIDENSGSAKDRSLRGIEVVVPIDLGASIGPMPGRAVPFDWVQKLREVLPLISAVGGHRSRGLGRAILSLEAE